MTNAQLKDYIANADLDVYIVRKDYATIKQTAEYDLDESFTLAEISKAVNQLANDAYFSRLAQVIQ